MRKSKNKGSLCIVLFILLVAGVVFHPMLVQGEGSNKDYIEKEQLEKINAYINQYYKESKIPGMSIVICKEDNILFEKQYGFADADTKNAVTENTYFELGSNSKAFTGLAIRKLESEGLLKLDDNIEKYIKDLKMKYNEEFPELKISNFLYHTSGIPFKSIGNIPKGSGEKALKDTVYSLISQNLERKPGTEFSYATINYDVLGYVIEQVTGLSYEDYTINHVFEPLGLKNTGFLYLDSKNLEVAKGYKLSYLKAREYKSAVYRGNAPAGYIAMNTVDLVKWIQLNMYQNSDCTKAWKEVIFKTHEADRSVKPTLDGSSYASGWNVYQSGTGKIAHGGNNANYSSYIIIRSNDNIGVGILANMNSEYTTLLANGIMDIIEGKESNYIYRDQYKTVATTMFVLTIICAGIILFSLIMSIHAVRDIIRKKRAPWVGLRRILKKIGILLMLFVIAVYCVYLLPEVLYSGLSWRFVLEWAPFSLMPGIILLGISVLLFFMYYLLVTAFPKKKDKYIFLLIVLSIISGLGNSIIIFTVNTALGKEEFMLVLFEYCMVGMLLYVFGQKYVRSKMMRMTNQYIFDMRMCLVDRVLNTSCKDFEKLNRGNINTVINGDIEVLSNSPNIIVGGITNLGTLICCFMYLAVLDIRAMALSICIIALAVSTYLFIGRKNNRLWKETRTLQDGFYNLINDLLLGFKQLKLNSVKQKAFRSDIETNCRNYTDKNTEAALNFVNVFIIGELLFTLVITSVAFLFPLVFADIHKSTLSAYVFVFLFMAGPLSGVMNSVPEFMRTKISYKRIKDFERSIEIEENSKVLPSITTAEVCLKMVNAEYCYDREMEGCFKIGPINCEFKSGEIIFITGGNGSGKTTLLKLISGLYRPTSGEILMNGRLAAGNSREYFSDVFSDFHLFKKIYGMEEDWDEAKLNEVLNMLEISSKISVKDGKLSTLNLSTGQKKRVALMISYMEDKPFYIFDEWAADQDPQFRKYFYEKILFDLKREGKCVIAITHDDRYFHLADKILKMDFGSLVESKEI